MVPFGHDPSVETGVAPAEQYTAHHCEPTRVGSFNTRLLTSGSGVYISLYGKIWRHVSMHWQQRKCQLWANCFMWCAWFWNLDPRFQMPLYAIHSGVTHVNHSAMIYIVYMMCVSRWYLHNHCEHDHRASCALKSIRNSTVTMKMIGYLITKLCHKDCATASEMLVLVSLTMTVADVLLPKRYQGIDSHHADILWLLYRMNHVTYTVRCRHNAVDFLKKNNKKHPIARPLGRVMGCLLWT